MVKIASTLFGVLNGIVLRMQALQKYNVMQYQVRRLKVAKK